MSSRARWRLGGGLVNDDGFVSPTTITVTDTRTGDPIDTLVSVSGPDFSLESADPDLTLEDATWCVKSATMAHDGTGMSGTSASTNKRGTAQDISYFVLYSVATVDPTPVAVCNDTTSSGGPRVTTTGHELGLAGPTSFLFEWEAYTVPDQFQVFYEGVLIHDTGVVGDSIGEGTGSATVMVPPAPAPTSPSSSPAPRARCGTTASTALRGPFHALTG